MPVVTSVTTFAVNRRVLAFAASRGMRPKSARLVLSKIRHVAKAALLGRRLRREHGVKGTGIMGLVFGSSDLNIVYTSRHFQPCAESFDDRFLFIGPSIGFRTETAASPGTRPQDGRDLCLAGHAVQRGSGVLPELLRGVRGPGCPGRHVDRHHHHRSESGRPPANIVVKPWVPQLDVLRRASVFVSHGGMNSVSESLYHGVPLVVVPQMGEQEIVARQVEGLGAGLCLAKNRRHGGRLRQSVHRVLGDDRFREQAAVAGKSFEAAGGAARGADAILAFTRAQSRRAH